jgi:hypothetical protein
VCAAGGTGVVQYLSRGVARPIRRFPLYDVDTKGNRHCTELALTMIYGYGSKFAGRIEFEFDVENALLRTFCQD